MRKGTGTFILVSLFASVVASIIIMQVSAAMDNRPKNVGIMGLTLRDFAAMAIWAHWADKSADRPELARRAYQQADILLSVRDQ